MRLLRSRRFLERSKPGGLAIRAGVRSTVSAKRKARRANEAREIEAGAAVR